MINRISGAALTRPPSASRAVLLVLAMIAASASAAAQDVFEVKETAIDDLKAVFATVRSTDEINARVRTGGTITSLSIKRGGEVKPGDVLATVADDKLALRMKVLDAQIIGLRSRAETAKAEAQRQEQLAQRGFAAGAKLDEARTALEVASNALKSAEAERSVITQQVEEGAVLAPAQGRVLTIPVTVGAVVMPAKPSPRSRPMPTFCALSCRNDMRASSKQAIPSSLAAANSLPAMRRLAKA